MKAPKDSELQDLGVRLLDYAIVSGIKGRHAMKMKLVLKGYMLTKMFGIAILFNESLYRIVAQMFNEIDNDTVHAVRFRFATDYGDLT